MNLMETCPIYYIPLFFCFLVANALLREIKMKFVLSLLYSLFNSTNSFFASVTRQKAKKLISTTCDFLKLIRTVLWDNKSDMTVLLSEHHIITGCRRTLVGTVWICLLYSPPIRYLYTLRRFRWAFSPPGWTVPALSLIHIWRCRRSTLCRSRWSPYH